VRLLLCVAVGVVFLGVNYLFNVNQELLVRSKIERAKESLNFSDDFIRELASLKESTSLVPDSAALLPNLIINKVLITKKLIQVDGEEFDLELKVKLKRINDRLVQIVGDNKNELMFFSEKKFNPSLPIELVNLKTSERLIVSLEPPKVVAKKDVHQSVSMKSFSRSKNEIKKGVRLFEGDLDIYQAIIPKFSKAPLRGSLVSGAISVNAGSLESLDIEVRNLRGEVKELSFNYSEIKDGGVFSFEDLGIESFGILSNDGEKGIRVRFSTGRFAGAIISFGEMSNSGSPNLPEEEVIKLNEQARSDFKKRALSNEFVQESQIRL
jgi:hypothetical protein